MKNPIVLFVAKLVASFLLFIGFLYFTGLNESYGGFFQKTNTAKYQWMQKGLAFSDYPAPDRMNNDTELRVEASLKPRGDTRMNTQKYSLRLYVMLLCLLLATPGIFKNGNFKRIGLALGLIFLYIQVKLVISIWYFAVQEGWPLMANIPTWLQGLLPHFYRFFVMSSSFNMLVLFAIWTLFCFDLIMNTFWSKTT